MEKQSSIFKGDVKIGIVWGLFALEIIHSLCVVCCINSQRFVYVIGVKWELKGDVGAKDPNFHRFARAWRRQNKKWTSERMAYKRKYAVTTKQDQTKPGCSSAFVNLWPLLKTSLLINPSLPEKHSISSEHIKLATIFS